MLNFKVMNLAVLTSKRGHLCKNLANGALFSNKIYTPKDRSQSEVSKIDALTAHIAVSFAGSSPSPPQKKKKKREGRKEG